MQNKKIIFLIVLLMFLCTQILFAVSKKFVLITSLYNETHPERMQEYITCLEKNLTHDLIEKINVIYDTKKDDTENKLLNYLKSKKVIITYKRDRPTYGYCFKLANECYSHRRVILSNADIYFNETLHALDGYDLTNKFLALTRYDIEKNGKIQLYGFYKEGVCVEKYQHSQDVWIFQTPIYQFKKNNFKLGTMGCDNQIAYQAWQSGFDVINPCLTIECIHVHVSQIRRYAWDRERYSDDSNPPSIKIPWTTLDAKKYPSVIPMNFTIEN